MPLEALEKVQAAQVIPCNTETCHRTLLAPSNQSDRCSADGLIQIDRGPLEITICVNFRRIAKDQTLSTQNSKAAQMQRQMSQPE